MRTWILASSLVSMVVASPALAAPPTNVTRPSITVVGDTLVADFGTWAGTEPVSVQGRWEVCGCGVLDDHYEPFGSASTPLPFSALDPIRFGISAHGPGGAPGQTKHSFPPPIPGQVFWSVALIVTASNSEGTATSGAFVNLKDSCFTTNRPENCISKKH